MAVTSVKRVRNRRKAGANALFQRTYTRVYRVTTDDPTDEGPTILIAVDPSTSLAIPQVGNVYPTDPGAFVVGLDATEDSEDGLAWIVEVQYGPYDAGQFPENPIDWPIKVVFGGTRYERIVYFDRNGDPILNSAEEGWEDPITVDDSRPTLTITRNELVTAFDLDLAMLYSDSLNDATWNTIAAGKAKMGTITTGDLQYNSNAQVWYYAVTYPVELNRDGWSKKLLDRGFTYLDGANKRRLILGPDGKKRDEPTLLDGSGHVLAPGGTPVVLTFDVIEELDWSGLNIDLSLRLGM